MKKLRVMLSETHNPWFNLATEEWIFREMAPDAETLFLWRNQQTVVIGRNQNPWSECNLSKMEADGVLLARRSTGGGAVFHDLGNTCFTFLSPRERYDRSANTEIVLGALREFGINGEASGRNDIVVPKDDGPRKVSGSAFRETKDRAFHHGTLLLGADLTRLGNYLTPNPKKLQSKGKASVRARVMNLSELSMALRHETLTEALIESFFKKHGGRCEIETLDHATLERIPSLQASFEHLSSWDWRFGHAPQFHHSLSEYLSWGFIEVFLDAENGRIKRAQVFSDALFPDLIEDFARHLHAKPHARDGVSGAVLETQRRHPERGSELQELETWLLSQMETAGPTGA